MVNQAEQTAEDEVEARIDTVEELMNPLTLNDPQVAAVQYFEQ